MATSTSSPPPPPENPPAAGAAADLPSPFSLLPDDLLLRILSLLPSAADPRLLPRLSGVSVRLRHLLLLSPLPSSLPLPLPPSPSLPYSTLHKLTVCCPGLSHAGVLFHDHSSDFGLSLEIGPDLSLSRPSPPLPSLPPPPPPDTAATLGSPSLHSATSTWSLFDDLYLDSSYDLSETLDNAADGTTVRTDSTDLIRSETFPTCSSSNQPQNLPDTSSPKRRKKHAKKKKWMGPTGAHLASGNWSLSREQGSKLLASRFRSDSLYICEWPGCVHEEEEKRKYMLFRGVFKDFKKSKVWRTIVDSKKGRVKLDCAYCTCNEMWDLHSAFCLRGFIGFHEDGEPVVRAYVCDNGHVSGAWTERSMYV